MTGTCGITVKVKENKVVFHGLDQPDSDLIEFGAGVITVKTPGHNYWSGRGMTSYSPSEYEVLEIIEFKGKESNGDIRCRVRWLTVFKARANEPTIPDTIETYEQYLERKIY